MTNIIPSATPSIEDLQSIIQELTQKLHISEQEGLKAEKERDDLRQHLIQLAGDGVEMIDYVQWLRNQIMRIQDRELKTIQELLEQNHLPKPYKLLTKKELYDHLFILTSAVEYWKTDRLNELAWYQTKTKSLEQQLQQTKQDYSLAKERITYLEGYFMTVEEYEQKMEPYYEELAQLLDQQEESDSESPDTSRNG